MIQHLRIDFPPIVKSQTLLHLGKVNILTGRNSGGKSTILRRIIEKPDIGITYEQSNEIKSKVRQHIRDLSRPDPQQINDWVTMIMNNLDGKILFTSSENEARDLILEAKEKSPVKSYNLEADIIQIVKALVSLTLKGDKPLLLSPKRRIPFETDANAMLKLDSEASSALSRLFYLQTQLPDSNERKVLDKIHASFNDITGYEFDVQMLNVRHPPQIQLYFRRMGDPWIVAQNEGLGLTEVLSIILYSLDGSHPLLLIEEPENHLHPDLQRRLLSFLNSVEDRQFILSTHSPVFLNPTMVDRIYFCKFSDGDIKIDDNTNRAEALSQIGVLAIDNLTSDAVLITEGKTDQVVIDYIVRKWLKAPANASISHVFLAGSMMVYFDPTPFAQLRNTFALLDLDTSNATAQGVFVKGCDKAGICPTKLIRYCLENYYTLDAIRAVFGEVVPNQIESLNETIPPWKQLADTVHDEDWWKGELKSARRISHIINQMKISDIEGTDLLEFCRKIKSVL